MQACLTVAVAVAAAALGREGSQFCTLDSSQLLLRSTLLMTTTYLRCRARVTHRPRRRRQHPRQISEGLWRAAACSRPLRPGRVRRWRVKSDSCSSRSGQPSCTLQLRRLPAAGVQLACSRSQQAAHCCCHVLLVSMWSLEQTGWMCVLDIVIYQGNRSPLASSACWTLCTQCQCRS